MDEQDYTDEWLRLTEATALLPGDEEDISAELEELDAAYWGQEALCRRGD